MRRLMTHGDKVANGTSGQSGGVVGDRALQRTPSPRRGEGRGEGARPKQTLQLLPLPFGERAGVRGKGPTRRGLLAMTVALTLIALCWSSASFAATEFVSSIKPTGGDYSTLATWEASNQCDLTAAATKEGRKK